MSFLLKIVQGPNAGAEIALTEGVTLSVGSADTCDIVFSDAAVEAQAFELEVTEERVMVILPGGKTIKLDPYHVTLVGTTAVAVGPLEGTWKELVWPKTETAAPAEEVEQPEEVAAPVAETPSEEKPRQKKSSHIGLWIFLLLVLLFAAAVAWAFWKYPEQSKHYTKTGWTWVCEKTDMYYKELTKTPPPPPPPETLAEAAEACGFSLSETSGRQRVFGNFATRAERLQATARAYAAQPGVQVDFADEESLKAAVDELLTLVSDGRVQAVKVEGRKLFLAGAVSSQAALQKILESLSSDVPKITETSCSAVTITGTTIQDIHDEEQRYRVPRLPADRRSPNAAKEDSLPIVGILTVPYPCLVLENGTRAMEGARFGEYTIEKIAADAVTVRGEDGAFVWRP